MSRHGNGTVNGYELTNDPLPSRRGIHGKYPFAGMLADRTKMFWLKPQDTPTKVRCAASMFARQNKSDVKFTIRQDPKTKRFGCWVKPQSVSA